MRGIVSDHGSARGTERGLLGSGLLVLGHWLIGYVHPYPDGNGRIARFLMNVELASGGFPWLVVRAADRDRYLCALDALSVDDDPAPFIDLVHECLGDARPTIRRNG